MKTIMNHDNGKHQTDPENWWQNTLSERPMSLYMFDVMGSVKQLGTFDSFNIQQIDPTYIVFWRDRHTYLDRWDKLAFFGSIMRQRGTIYIGSSLPNWQ